MIDAPEADAEGAGSVDEIEEPTLRQADDGISPIIIALILLFLIGVSITAIASATDFFEQLFGWGASG